MNYVPVSNQRERFCCSPSSGSKVAIITRTKNRNILLRRALESILSQTHQDWHVYLVNDGGSRADIELLWRTYNDRIGGRATILHNERSLGLAKAVNTALRVVEGDFLVTHDDDDTWHPEFLERSTGFLGKEINSQFLGVMSRFYNVIEKVESGKVTEIGRELVQRWPVTLKFFPLLYWNAYPPICYMIRMNAVRRLGLVNEELALLEDTDYLRRLLILGDVAILQEPLAYYHLRPLDGAGQLQNSVLSMTDDYNIYDRRLGNELIRNFLADNPSNIGLVYALAALSAKIDELKFKFERFALDETAMRALAREIYYEQNRHSLGYKVMQMLQRTYRRLRRI